MRRRRGLTCRQVDDRLMAYVKGGLSAAKRQAVADHLLACASCARAAEEARALDAQLLAEADRLGPALSRTASARIQERIYRTMRRGLIMQRISKSFTRLAGLAALAALVIGVWRLSQDSRQPAGSGENASQPVGGSTEGVTITFAAFEIQRDRYEALTRQFKEVTGIDVRFRSFEEIVGSENFDWATDARQIAGSADTFSIQLNDAILRQGALQPLDTFIESEASFGRDDFFASALASAQLENKTWLLPASLSLDMILYDKEAFDQAGLPHPRPGWTWDEFLAAAQALTSRNGEEVTRWGFVPSFINPVSFIAARAGIPAEDLAAGEAALADPQVAEALRQFAELAQAHQVAPLAASTEERSRFIEQGRAAMWNELAPSTSVQRRLATGKIGIVPYPVYAGRADTTSAYASGHAMSAGTQHPQESWRWLVFLSRHAASAGGDDLPARQPVAEANGFWKNLDGNVAAAYRFAMEHARPGLFGFAAFRTLDQAVEDVLNGATVEDALAAAQAALGEAAGSAPAELDPVVVSTPAPSLEEAARVRFMYNYDSLSSQPYEGLAREFKQTNPGVQVLPVANSSADPTFEQAAATSDCFVWSRGWGLPREAELGRHVVNLQPLVDADPTFLLGDFYAAALDAFRAQGDLYAIPAEFKPVSVLLYDKRLFDAAGIDYPRPGWTLDDFRNAAVTLTKGSGDDKQYGFLSLWFEPSLDMLWILAQPNGALYFDIDSGLPRAHFADPATIHAMQWYADLANLYGLDRIEGEEPEVRWPVEYDPDVNFPLSEKRRALVEGGQVAMWLPAFLESHPEAVAPLPLNEGGYVRGFHDGFYISAASPHVEACWQWLRFLADRSPRFVRYSPVRQSAFASPAYAGRVGSEFAEAMRFSIEHSATNDAADTLVDTLGIRHYGSWLDEAGRAVYLQERDAATAMNALQQKVEAYIACLDRQEGFGNEALQDACAAEVDSQ